MGVRRAGESESLDVPKWKAQGSDGMGVVRGRQAGKNF